MFWNSVSTVSEIILNNTKLDELYAILVLLFFQLRFFLTRLTFYVVMYFYKLQPTMN